MDADLYLVIGIVLGALSLPSIVGAISEGRAPRAASIVIMVAGFMVVYALQHRTYTINDIPNAFVRVIGRYIN